MASLVFRRTNGEVLASLELTERQFADIHTVTWDRDKHRLYFSLKYTFHAELKNEIQDVVPASRVSNIEPEKTRLACTTCHDQDCSGSPETHAKHAHGRSKSVDKRLKVQAKGK